MKNYSTIAIISTIAGCFISISDWIVQMQSIESDHFIRRITQLTTWELWFSSHACVFLFPLWASGTWLLYRITKDAAPLLAKVTSILLAYSMLLLIPFHHSYNLFGMLANTGIQPDDAQWQLLVNINSPFYPVMFLLLPLSWIGFGIISWRKKSPLPRWTLVINPVFLSLSLELLAILSPGIFKPIQPGIFSAATTLNFWISYHYLKKQPINNRSLDYI
ncbi:hypothetical protein DMA11_11720 [Marinilabiliaceae bacterium JC017]|nr:hypothetical protein DMA11_11720 [Marinilabiliaceae bacterium JC017]